MFVLITADVNPRLLTVNSLIAIALSICVFISLLVSIYLFVCLSVYDYVFVCLFVSPSDLFSTIND